MISDTLVTANQRSPVLSAPGLILLGPDNHMTYNVEAVQILAYPSPIPGVKRVATLVSQKMAGMFKQCLGSDGEAAVTEFSSGRRQYHCTRYVLNMQGLQAARTVVVLMERIGSQDVTIQELCNGLHLTPREREVVGHLVRGLTSKEVAQHMGISPNTVKSFVRLVMTKVGVSTRAGLVGRVTGIIPRPRMTSEAADQRGMATTGFLRAG